MWGTMKFPEVKKGSHNKLQQMCDFDMQVIVICYQQFNKDNNIKVRARKG